jgi:hypothetical protein
MVVRNTSAIITCAALTLAGTPALAFACICADAVDHHILPTLPKAVDADATVLKVLLNKIPNWNAQGHDGASLSVLALSKECSKVATLA